MKKNNCCIFMSVWFLIAFQVIGGILQEIALFYLDNTIMDNKAFQLAVTFNFFGIFSGVLLFFGVIFRHPNLVLAHFCMNVACSIVGGIFLVVALCVAKVGRDVLISVLTIYMIAIGILCSLEYAAFLFYKLVCNEKDEDGKTDPLINEWV